MKNRQNSNLFMTDKRRQKKKMETIQEKDRQRRGKMRRSN